MEPSESVRPAPATFAFLIPCRSHIPADAFSSILGCVAYTQSWWRREKGEGARLALLTRSRAHVSWTREELIRQAIEIKADWLLWLDDDAVPPIDLVPRLYAHQRDMVAPLFFKRGFPYDSTCQNLRGGSLNVGRNPGGIPVSPFPRRLFRCDAVGFHALLMRGEVAQGMALAYPGTPLFQIGQDVGEDMFFCELAKHAGYELWIDSTFEVGHVGAMVIDSDYILSLKAFEEAPAGAPAAKPEAS